MTRQITPVNSDIYLSGQVASEDLPSLKEAGVRLVVNHRPDGEEPGQVASVDLEKAAKALGMNYVHAPVSGMPSATAVEATAAALATLSAGDKALLFCKSGMRSSVTWALAERSRGVDADILREQALAAGYDLSRLPL